MANNLTLEEISVFTWDTDGTMWSSFNTPFAHSVYKWTAIIILLNVFDIIFILGPTIWFFFYWIPTPLLWINDMRNKFNNGYTKVGKHIEKNIIKSYFKCLGSIWNGHELFGQENIPDGPAVFYIYHGPVAYDGLFAYGRIESEKRRIYIIAHKKEANLYGFRRTHQVADFCAFSRQEIIDLLNEGNQFIIAVGGVEESRISDNNYRVFKSKRCGLGHIAKATTERLPILPIFTRNIQEAFWIPWFARPFIKYCPLKKLAAIPAAGGLPVKLTTYIGKEIDYDVSASAEEIMNQLQCGLQKHIDKHQIIPGNKLRAFRERFCSRNDILQV